MKEDFLHYIWQHQYFDKADLTTTDGEGIQILKAGYYNTDAGPDFKEAIIKIGDIEWSGSIEIHLRSSDWDRHSHQTDKKYNQVILHVVWEADKAVYREDGTLMPVIVLCNRVDLSLLDTYKEFQLSKAVIPCASFWHMVPEVTKISMMERSLIERLEFKGEEILQLFNSYGHDWEQTAYYSLLRSFGFKINQQAFGQLANALPQKIVRKQISLSQLEALLFGQSGFLEEPEGDYAIQLKKEYSYLSYKFKLQPLAMSKHQWNFLRMRPANFPTVRLAQLASVLNKRSTVFTTMLEANSIKDFVDWFRSPVSDYWQNHYMFDRAAKAKQISMGSSSAHNLIINAVVPILSAYTIYSGNKQYIEKAIALLEQLTEDSNKITRKYEILGWKSKSAADTQAALGLYKLYCAPVNCMHCGIGNKIMKQNVQLG